MPNESTPPIRDLPAEIEAALETVQQRWTELGRFDRTGDIFVAENAAEHLRQAIRAALDDQDAALRERAERIRVRLLALAEGRPVRPTAYVESAQGLQPGDLADDLRPREDVLP